LIALYFVLPETVISRFTSIGNLKDNSTSYRVYIWLGSLAMLKDGYWLCGVGPGDTAFNAVYPAYSYNTIVAPHAHNLFLQIVCDAGICALAVFVLVLFWYFRSLCMGLAKKQDFAGKMLHIGFISGMAGFLVQAMTDYSFYNYRVMLIFWVYLALGMVVSRRSELAEGGLWE
jgi:O-antigen ligase